MKFSQNVIHLKYTNLKCTAGRMFTKWAQPSETTNPVRHRSTMTHPPKSPLPHPALHWHPNPLAHPQQPFAAHIQPAPSTSVGHAQCSQRCPSYCRADLPGARAASQPPQGPFIRHLSAAMIISSSHFYSAIFSQNCVLQFPEVFFHLIQNDHFLNLSSYASKIYIQRYNSNLNLYNKVVFFTHMVFSSWIPCGQCVLHPWKKSVQTRRFPTDATWAWDTPVSPQPDPRRVCGMPRPLSLPQAQQGWDLLCSDAPWRRSAPQPAGPQPGGLLLLPAFSF